MLRGRDHFDLNVRVQLSELLPLLLSTEYHPFGYRVRIPSIRRINVMASSKKCCQLI